MPLSFKVSNFSPKFDHMRLIVSRQVAWLQVLRLFTDRFLSIGQRILVRKQACGRSFSLCYSLLRIDLSFAPIFEYRAFVAFIILPGPLVQTYL